MMANAYELSLRQGAKALGLSLNDTQIAQLLGYHALIQKWNKVYNLTAIRDPAEMLTHHLLDSLAIVVPLTRQTTGASIKMLDVGAGAGLPGVVVAICCPQVSVSVIILCGSFPLMSFQIRSRLFSSLLSVPFVLVSCPNPFPRLCPLLTE